MSLRLTLIRVWWDGRAGWAQYQGAVKELDHAPDALPECYEIDFCPEFDTFEIRPRACDRRRDIEPPERVLLMAWLKRIFGAD